MQYPNSTVQLFIFHKQSILESSHKLHIKLGQIISVTVPSCKIQVKHCEA